MIFLLVIRIWLFKYVRLKFVHLFIKRLWSNSSVFLLDGYQTTDLLYKWNPRDDNTSAIYVNNEVELPQFELVGVEKTSDINEYNIGKHT